MVHSKKNKKAKAAAAMKIENDAPALATATSATSGSASGSAHVVANAFSMEPPVTAGTKKRSSPPGSAPAVSSPVVSQVPSAPSAHAPVAGSFVQAQSSASGSGATAQGGQHHVANKAAGFTHDPRNSFMYMTPRAQGGFSSGVGQPPAIRTVRNVRKRDETCDARITSTDVIRNEVQIVTATRGDKIVYKKVSAAFTPDQYNYANDLHNMEETEMAEHLSGKFVQFELKNEEVEARFGVYPEQNVINRFYTLPLGVVELIENVIVRIPVHDFKFGPTKLNNNRLTAKEFKKTDDESSTICRTFPLIWDLAYEIKKFTSLARLDIIVELPEPLIFDKDRPVHPDLFNVALPFCEVFNKDFPNWNLKWACAGGHPFGEFVPRFLKGKLDRKEENFAAGDKKAIDEVKYAPIVRPSLDTTIYEPKFIDPNQTGPHAKSLTPVPALTGYAQVAGSAAPDVTTAAVFP